MREISNTGLVLLVVAAIVVSIGGTIFSISKIGQQPSNIIITGLATSGIGTANLTVDTTASITLADDAINLGTIKPYDSNDSYQKNDFWKVNNDGSVNVSIQVYGTQQNGNGRGRGPFTTATSAGGCLNNVTTLSLPGYSFSSSSSCFQIRCNSTLSAVNASVNNIGCNATTNWTVLPAVAGQEVFIFDLDYRAGGGGNSVGDNATFAVNVTVPPDEPSGAKSQAVTFLAASSE